MADKVFPVYPVARVWQVKQVYKARVATSDLKAPAVSRVEWERLAMRVFKDQPVPLVGLVNAVSVAKKA